jgi:hypothetical protein
MSKFPIGFKTNQYQGTAQNTVHTDFKEDIIPKKSVVSVYFPSRGVNYAYYNDLFDLKVGDMVYVDGKLSGTMGQVTQVNYSFKINISEYKKVTELIDTRCQGDFFITYSHFITFDRNAISKEKIKLWFKPADTNTEYVTGFDTSKGFSLDNLSALPVCQKAAEKGHSYYMDNKVAYICVDSGKGYAIVEGSEPYEVDFFVQDGIVSNLTCSCFCTGVCKHQFATLLQLKETLDEIFKNYIENYNFYFAAISKSVFTNMILNKNHLGSFNIDA